MLLTLITDTNRIETDQVLYFKYAHVFIILFTKTAYILVYFVLHSISSLRSLKVLVLWRNEFEELPGR